MFVLTGKNDVFDRYSRRICGWCAGCNPSSVMCGIQLCGLPAPPAGGIRRLFALAPCGSAVSPKPVASSTSKASQPATGGTVSVRCQDSRPTTHVVAALHGGWSFLRPAARQPPPSSPTKTTNKPHTYKPSGSIMENICLSENGYDRSRSNRKKFEHLFFLLVP